VHKNETCCSLVDSTPHYEGDDKPKYHQNNGLITMYDIPTELKRLKRRFGGKNSRWGSKEGKRREEKERGEEERKHVWHIPESERKAGRMWSECSSVGGVEAASRVYMMGGAQSAVGAGAGQGGQGIKLLGWVCMRMVSKRQERAWW
jgi:hypothetical protein